jgi:hypothetical protein
MRARIRLLRHQGRATRRSDPIPSTDTKSPAFVGELVITENRDALLSRQVMRARLLSVSNGTETDLIPPLLDAQLLLLSQQEIRISGVENLDGQLVAQTWVAEVLGC